MGIMKKKADIRNSFGFTMIEVLVTIAIIGIMAGIAIPSLLTYFPKSRLSGATRVLAGDLMAARMEAVKLNQTVYLQHDTSQQYRIIDNNGVIKTRNLQEDYADVTVVDFDQVGFNSRGAALAAKAITVTNPSGTKGINVTISGRVQIN